MERRTLLKVLGAGSAGAAVVSGTGAFTSVEADRDVTVQVAADANAYLALEAIGPNAPYTTTADGQFGIDLTGSNATPAGGQGVNPNAITVFEELFEVRNQGAQAVDVEVTPLLLVDDDGGNALAALIVPQTAFPAVTLAPGDGERYSLVVDAFSGGAIPDVPTDDTITVTGEAT